MTKTTQELCDIVNSLSNEDLMFIMNACSDRITVYIGSYKRHQISFDGIDCCSNGCIIQINPQDKGEDTFDIEKFINEINARRKEEEKIDDLKNKK